MQRKREQLELDAEIAASTAKFAVLQIASDCLSESQAPSDGMNPYLEWNKGQKTTSKMFNLATKSNEPLAKSALPQSSFLVPCKHSSAQWAPPDEKGQNAPLD